MTELNFPNNPSDNTAYRIDANNVLYENSNSWGPPVFTGPTMGRDTGGASVVYSQEGDD